MGLNVVFEITVKWSLNDKRYFFPFAFIYQMGKNIFQSIEWQKNTKLVWQY